MVGWLFAFWVMTGAPAVALIAASYIGYAFPLNHAITYLMAFGIIAAAFAINYRGLLTTVDGTVIAPGYGEFDCLRDRLRKRLPFASPQQSNLGHISLGRILDPVGQRSFAALKTLARESREVEHGTFLVDEVKYIHECQWYMEDREIVDTIPLGTTGR
jgi:hypothetical protein